MNLESKLDASLMLIRKLQSDKRQYLEMISSMNNSLSVYESALEKQKKITKDLIMDKEHLYESCSRMNHEKIAMWNQAEGSR